MKALSLLTLLALFTLNASAAPITRISFTISFEIAAQVQSTEVNSNSTTITVPKFTQAKITSKSLMTLLAQDEFVEARYPTNTFPVGSKLVYLGDQKNLTGAYVIEDKSGTVLLDVNDLITMAPETNATIYSYVQNNSTGLYKPIVRSFAGVTSFDDTGVAGGTTEFNMTQVWTATTTDTESASSLTESSTLKLSAGAGAGVLGGVPVVLTCPAQTTHGKLILP